MYTENDVFIFIIPLVQIIFVTVVCLKMQVWTIKGKITVKNLFLVGIFIWCYWWYKQKLPKYETAKYRFKLSYTISNTWTHFLSMLVSVSINKLLNRRVCFNIKEGAQWLSGSLHDSRPRGPRFEPHRHHCVVSLSKTH